MHVEVALLDVEVERRAEQVLDLGLLLLEQPLVVLGLVVLAAPLRRGLEEPRRRELLRVAGDHHALRADQHRQRLLEPALRRLVEDRDVEQRRAREDLRDRLRARHPHRAQVEERIAALDVAAVRDHLPHPEHLLAPHEQPAPQLGRDRGEPVAGRGDEAIALPLEPAVLDERADPLLLLLVEGAVAIVRDLQAVGVEVLQLGVRLQPPPHLRRERLLEEPVPAEVRRHPLAGELLELERDRRRELAQQRAHPHQGLDRARAGDERVEGGRDAIAAPERALEILEPAGGDEAGALGL